MIEENCIAANQIVYTLRTAHTDLGGDQVFTHFHLCGGGSVLSASGTANATAAPPE